MQENNEPEWKDNTKDNPFWLSTVPIEVRFINGQIKEFKCPKCNKGFGIAVKQWREIKSEKTTPLS